MSTSTTSAPAANAAAIEGDVFSMKGRTGVRINLAVQTLSSAPSSA
jgi:hypothetical protein